APGQPDGHVAAAVGAAARRQRAYADPADARRERQRCADRGSGAVLRGAEGRRHRSGDGPLSARGTRHPRIDARRRLDRSEHQVVREALSAVVAKVVAAAIAEALVLGAPAPAPDATAGLPGDAQKQLAEYRAREATFKSALTEPPGADAAERALYDRRVAVERVVVALFPRRDSAKTAAAFALDIDLDHVASFADDMLRDLPVPWLAPYLNLLAGHAKLCGDRPADAKHTLTLAQKSGVPPIRVAAEDLLSESACLRK